MPLKFNSAKIILSFVSASLLISCTNNSGAQLQESNNLNTDFKNSALVSEIFTADPSAHIFEDRIYIYASHDIESGGIEDDSGNHFNMIDYHVLSMNLDGSDVTVHPVALSVEDVDWAESKFWAPDAAFKNGKYYLYFPAKDKDNVFKLGVAVSDNLKDLLFPTRAYERKL